MAPVVSSKNHLPNQIVNQFRRKGVLMLLIMLWGFSSLGAQLMDSPATEALELGLGSATIRQGMRFTATVDVPTTDLSSFTIQSPEWPQGLSLVLGPELSRIPAPRIDLPSPGTRITYFLRADQPGWAIIPDFTAQTDSTVYSIRGAAVPVLPPGTVMTVPPVLQWRVGSPVLVSGQSTSAFLELSFMEEYLLPESVSVDPLSSGVLEEVTGLGTVLTQEMGGRTFQRYPVASFILTAEESGQLVLPPAQVLISGVRVISPPLTVSVNPVPGILDSTGAVGTFTLTGAPSAEVVRVGEILRFTLRLEGEGNLNYLRIPDPLISGGRISSQTDSFRFTPVLSGWRGFREVVYRIIPEREGVMQITVPQFPVFNPETSRIVQPPLQSFSIQVEPGVVIALESQGELGLLSPDQVLGYNLLELYRRPETYLLLIPPGFIGIGIFVSKRRQSLSRFRGASTLMVLLLFMFVLGPSSSAFWSHISFQQQRELLILAEEQFDSGNFSETLMLYRQVAELLEFTNPGLTYNQSIALAADNRVSEAVFYLRQARRILPGDPLFSNALALLEESLGLTRQFTIPSIPRGDAFFFLSFGVAFFFLLFLPYWLKDIHAGKVMTLTLLMVVFSLGIAGLVWYSNIRYETEGIVRQDDEMGNVTKIPESAASVWLQLPPGTSVLLRDTSGDFSLIRTSYGIEGWILSNNVWKRGQQYE